MGWRLTPDRATGEICGEAPTNTLGNGVRVARNHRTTYAQRNELARRRGFKNYTDQRKSTEYAQSHAKEKNSVKVSRSEAASRQEYEDMVRRARLQYLAFVVADQQDYVKHGHKYNYLVDELHVLTEDEWDAHYPNGTREYGRRVA